MRQVSGGMSDATQWEGWQNTPQAGRQAEGGMDEASCVDTYTSIPPSLHPSIVYPAIAHTISSITTARIPSPAAIPGVNASHQRAPRGVHLPLRDWPDCPAAVRTAPEDWMRERWGEKRAVVYMCALGNFYFLPLKVC